MMNKKCLLIMKNDYKADKGIKANWSEISPRTQKRFVSLKSETSSRHLTCLRFPTTSQQQS